MLARLDKPLRRIGAVKTAEANLGRVTVASALEIEPWNRRVHEMDGQAFGVADPVLAVVISAVNAILRKTFDISSNSWLELQWVLFSIVFLLCSPWTLLDNEHIRIDIVSNDAAENWVRNVPSMSLDMRSFLMPLCIVMIITGGPFFMRSFEINEQSGNAGGLPQWPAKSLVIVGFAFLLVQGISELIKRIAVMRGLIPDPHASQVHALEAEVEHLVEAIEKR